MRQKRFHWSARADSVHPLAGVELRALRRRQREQEPGRYVFVSERGAPMGPPGFRRMVERLGAAAKMPLPVHPHMLRHSTGYKLANQGVDTRSLQHYLGHRNIQDTVRYTELSRQYRQKPARCQRTRVSGRTIVMALSTDGNQRYSWMKNSDRIREVDATAHLALQHDQLMSERGILCFKPALRLEW
jgi:site-specific recombinase XerC